MSLFPSWLLSLCLWLASLSSGALWSYGSAFVVLVGVVGETITELTEWIKPESARKKIAKISAIVLILGLTGDLLAIRETQLEVAALTKEAGNAKDSAERAANAASRAETAANDLQNQLLFEGPREKLLGRVAKSFVDAMRPFAGQKIEIRINPSGIPDPKDAEEMRGFVNSIKFFLGQVSGWSISETQGDNGWGITLAVRRKSSLATRNAANALASAFVNSGVTDMNKQKPVARVVDAGSVIDRENGPPETIVLYVGRHP